MNLRNNKTYITPQTFVIVPCEPLLQGMNHESDGGGSDGGNEPFFAKEAPTWDDESDDQTRQLWDDYE